MMMHFGESRKLIVFDNRIQANLLESILQEKDIPFMITSYHDPAYDGIWQEQKGWGHLEAPKEYHQEILSIFSDIKNHGQEGVL